MKSVKKPSAPPDAVTTYRNPRRLWRAALIAAAYLCAFILLDFCSQQFQVLRGVVAWYPPAGLTYALLLVFGVRFAPAVMIALFISTVFIYRMPQPPYLLLLWAFIISLIYSVAAAFLRKRIRFDWQALKLRDVAWLVVTAVCVSALLAVLSVSSSALSSDMPRSEVLRAIFHWWIGETVGILTVTPFLLIYVMPGLKRFAEGQPARLPARRLSPRPSLSAIGQFSSMALTLYWVFGTHVLDEFRPMYLISVPIIWIALQRGFKGVSAAILALNTGVVLAQWFFQFSPARLGELELLMIVNCIVGLLMGVVVTERKQLEHKLQQSEMQFRNLAENSPDLIAQFDRQCRHLYVNAAAAKAGLYSQEEYTGKTISEVGVPEQEAEKWEKRIRNVLETGQPYDVIDAFETTTGPLYFNTKFVPEYDTSGKIFSVQSIARDITEGKLAEIGLKKAKDFLDNILNRIGVPVFVKDDCSRFTLVNNALCDMLGMERKNIIGQTLGESLPKDQMDHFLEVDRMVLDSGIENLCEEQLTGQSGKIFIIITKKTLYVDEQGKKFIIGLIHDITGQKQVEEEIRRKNDELLAVNTQLQEIMKNQDRSRLVLLGILEDEQLAKKGFAGKRGAIPYAGREYQRCDLRPGRERCYNLRESRRRTDKPLPGGRACRLAIRQVLYIRKTCPGS